MKKGIDTYKRRIRIIILQRYNKNYFRRGSGLNTAELFTKISDLLGLTKAEYENKIGDYYTILATDKRFIMLEDGTWDLSTRHKSQKIDLDDEEDDDDEFEEMEENIEEEDKDLSYDNVSDDNYDDSDDDLKDLVIIDEDEVESE